MWCGPGGCDFVVVLLEAGGGMEGAVDLEYSFKGHCPAMPEAWQNLITEPRQVGAKQHLLLVSCCFSETFSGFQHLPEQPIYFKLRDEARVISINLVRRGIKTGKCSQILMRIYLGCGHCFLSCVWFLYFYLVNGELKVSHYKTSEIF